MTAWVAAMTGNVMAHLFASERRRWQVPFTVFFKAVIGFAALGLISAGAALSFVHIGAAVELAIQISALLIGAILGGYGAVRAARDASTKR
jgi:hypothetical protein